MDFPGHFLVALEGKNPTRRGRATEHRQMIVDVFAGGVPLAASDMRSLLKRVEGPDAELRPGVLQPMSSRSVLIRLQPNTSRRLADNDLSGALSTIEDMLRIAPDTAVLWREAALVNQHLEHVGAAVHCYERFLDLVPQGDAALRTRAAIDELRSRLN